MKIVHTYINNMYIQRDKPEVECFANRWGLVAQAELGHEVTLICGGEQKNRVEYHWRGIKVIELPTLWGINNTSRILRGFIKELRLIDADVFHSHHYSSLLPELTLLIGKHRKIPTYVTFHNTFLEGPPVAKILGTFYLIFMQPFLPFFNKVFFISDYLKNKASFSIILKRKKVTLYNNFTPIHKTKREKIKDSIVFLGRISSQKGVDILLNAIYLVKKDYPNVSLHIIGSGSKDYLQKMQSITKTLNLKNTVTFHGRKTGQDKWDLLASSEIMVVPSKDEGFGNVVVEGQLSRLPLVVSSGGALREAAGGHCIIFKNRSHRDLSTKILLLLSNKKLQQRVAEEGNSHAIGFIQHNLGKEIVKQYQLN